MNSSEDINSPPLASLIIARPLSEYHEDFGDVLWWIWPLQEPPYCGSPLCDDWPGYHTHWTRITVPIYASDDTSEYERGVKEGLTQAEKTRRLEEWTNC